MSSILKCIIACILAGSMTQLACKKQNSFENWQSSRESPIANAGADQAITFPKDSAILDGSSSIDPDGPISFFQWTKIDGPVSFTLMDATAETTMVKALTQGIYHFELKVIDAGGLFSKDTVKVTVNVPIHQPPITNSLPDIIITLPLDSVYLDGMPHAGMNKFQWSYISGPPGSTLAISNILYPGLAIAKDLTPGQYSFQLEVTTPSGIVNYNQSVLVIDDPQERNSITFKNLRWFLADQYGTGTIDLNLSTPAQPNLFADWDKINPVEILLQEDEASPWLAIPIVQSGVLYAYDAARPTIWIARLPPDPGWVGKKSSIKVKIL